MKTGFTKTLRTIARWTEDRTGLARTIRPLARHPVPPTARWSYIFGSATLIAFLIQMVTGAALATLYVPSAGQAYESLRFITESAFLGRFLRGAHFFGASAMIVLMGIHLVRVFLFAAYKFPREMSWITGSVLMLFVLGLGFTGQLLRWDQNAVWSVVVGAEQAGRTPVVGNFLAHFVLGGESVGAATLTRFYALHVFVLPGFIILVLGLHLYLVIRNGISEPPDPERPVDRHTYRSWYRRMLDDRGVPFWPDAAWRDAVGILVVIVVVLALARIFGPPALGDPPDPTNIQAHPRPDWYFLFYFALLALMPHGLEDYVIILGPVLGGVVLIALPLVAPAGHRALRKRPWALVSVISIITIIGALTIAGVNADWSPHFDPPKLPASVVASKDDSVVTGAEVFHDRACISCHRISGYGGRRGPDLTNVGHRLTSDQMTIRILNGGYNMPAYGSILDPGELDALVAFLQSRE
jgi:ubiquinol-cytochrome c reductase cytochrome b subunit